MNSETLGTSEPQNQFVQDVGGKYKELLEKSAPVPATAAPDVIEPASHRQCRAFVVL